MEAVWEINSYTITSAAGEGSGTMASVTAQYGPTYNLPENGFTAPEGKRFKAWSVGGTEYAAGVSITISGKITVEAVWEINTYTITFAAGEGSGFRRLMPARFV